MATEFKRMQQLRDTAANWAINNPVILDGEITWSTDDGVMKIGDGVTAYTLLADFAPPASIASINDIGDVVITTPVTTEFLRFNGVNWINSSADLNSLSDVDLTTTTPVAGNSLVFDGAAWIPSDVTGGGGGVSVLDDLLDVDTTTTTPTLRSFLEFDGVNFVPVTEIDFRDYKLTTAPAVQEGRTFYDSQRIGFFYYNDDPTEAFAYSDSVIRVRNNTGSTITKGQAVFITGAIGKTLTVALAQADNPATSNVSGVVASVSILNNGEGWIKRNGFLIDLDTQGFTEGTTLFLSETTAGGFSTTKPIGIGITPVRIGVVTSESPTLGEISLEIENETNQLNDLSDVNLSSILSEEILRFDGFAWVNSENRPLNLFGLFDDDIKPNVAHNSVDIVFRFFGTTLEGLTGPPGVQFQDLLVLDSGRLGAGGDINALSFDKIKKQMLLWQADVADTTWGTPNTIPMLEVSQTWTALQRFDGDLDVSLIRNAGIIDFETPIGASQGINVGQLLISDNFVDVGLVPVDGAHVKGQISSGVAAGTAPFIIISSTTVTNLSADLLDGIEAAAFIKFADLNTPALFPTDWVVARFIAPALISTQHIDARGWTQETDWTASLRVQDFEGVSTYNFGTSTDGEFNTTQLLDSAIIVSTQGGRTGAWLEDTNVGTRQFNPPFTYAINPQDIYFCEISMFKLSGDGLLRFGGTSATSETNQSPLSHERFVWNYTTEIWDQESDFSDVYFWSGDSSGEWVDIKSYIIGSEVNVADVPPPVFRRNDIVTTVEIIRLIKLKPNNVFAYNRFVRASTTTSDTSYFGDHRVTDMAMGRILATHIQTKNLSSIQADLGAITGGSITITSPTDARNSLTIDPSVESPLSISGSDGTTNPVPFEVFSVTYGTDTEPASVNIFGDGLVNGTAGNKFIKSGAAFTDQAITDINPWYAGGGTEGSTGSTTIADGATITASATTGATVFSNRGTFAIRNSGSYKDETFSLNWTRQTVTVTIQRTAPDTETVFSESFTGTVSNIQDTEPQSPMLWFGNFSTIAVGGFTDNNATEGVLNTYELTITVSGGTNGDTTYTVDDFTVTPQGWLMPRLDPSVAGFWHDPSTGFIMQWGQINDGNNSGDFNEITFPLTFTTCLGVQVTTITDRNDGSQYDTALWSSLTNQRVTATYTSTTFRVTHSSAASGYTWLAYGFI